MNKHKEGHWSQRWFHLFKHDHIYITTFNPINLTWKQKCNGNEYFCKSTEMNVFCKQHI